jgi:hypothetical protein
MEPNRKSLKLLVLGSVRYKRLLAILIVLPLLALLGGCASGAVTTPSPSSDHRILGITANPRPVPPPTQQDAINAETLVANAGARGAVLTFKWNELETSPGVFSLPTIQNSITYSTSQGFVIYLGIQLINTVAREIPSDLQGTAWNDPVMETRFHALLDAIRPYLNSQVQYISIGNEVDVYLAANPAEWAAYQSFYENALAYIHSTLPGVQVGVTSTFTGASGGQKPNVIQLNTMSDVWIFTYYPIGVGFVPNGPQSPIADFVTMRSMAGNHPVVLQEVGYPTSTVISSSESDQATYVSNVFQAWQSGSQQMPFLNYFALHDLTPTFCSSLAQYYGDPTDPAFQAYLCSLGLHHDDGTVKPAWQILVNSAAAQGFPH